jgi:HAD superfamily hydrolase (TIGR01450 family)
MAWVLDLDGVLWLTGRALPGAPEAVARLRASGQRVVFITNNSGPKLEDHIASLAAIGVPADPDDIGSSAHAAAALLEPGSTAYVLGGPGVVEALHQRGVEVVGGGVHCDTVVVGRTTEFDYDRLRDASTAIREGSRFVATNLDPTLPTTEGLVPGAGSIVAAVQVASGSEPVVAGKPFVPTADLVRSRVGTPTMVVGDRADTDGALARQLGAPFGLVLTGVTKKSDLPVDPAPDVVADSLADLVAQYA